MVLLQARLAEVEAKLDTCIQALNEYRRNGPPPQPAPPAEERTSLPPQHATEIDTMRRKIDGVSDSIDKLSAKFDVLILNVRKNQG